MAKIKNTSSVMSASTLKRKINRQVRRYLEGKQTAYFTTYSICGVLNKYSDPYANL